MRDAFSEGSVYFPGLDGGTLFARPERIVTAYTVEDVIPALETLRQAVASGMHAAGFVAYEASPAFDEALAAHSPGDLPLVWFGLYGEGVSCPIKNGEGGVAALDWREGISDKVYRAAFAAIREEIAAGNTYQVNYTWPLRAEFDGNSEALFTSLHARQSTPFSAYLNTGRYEVLSVSPELFFRLDGSRVFTEPMKGTAPRGRYFEEDAWKRRDLQHAEKERAENLMIVDLLRNDLGRIARSGTVQTDSLFETHRYDTVWQMTSRISASTETDVPEIFAALFPCGSVTGAPKVRTSQIIRREETGARGVYCGAIGWWRPGRQACFSVAIRTLTVDRDRGEATYPVGSGVTWDAEAATELQECRQKAAVLFESRPEFELLETIRFDGGYTLLDRHLTRMRESASYFGYVFDAENILASLDDRSVEFDGPQRVRLLSDKYGKLRIEATPLPTQSSPPFRLALAKEPVSSQDPFLFHKTTHRAVYEMHRIDTSEADDVILWNERGEITETTIGNIVIELGGKRLTPPRDCGLLAGTFRAELLESGEIEEAVITKPTLQDAQRIWLINSVRGWVDAVLVVPSSSESTLH